MMDRTLVALAAIGAAGPLPGGEAVLVLVHLEGLLGHLLGQLLLGHLLGRLLLGHLLGRLLLLFVFLLLFLNRVGGLKLLVTLDRTTFSYHPCFSEG